MGRMFGTDGVRGVANAEPMTPETVLRIGRAVAAVCARRGAKRPRVVIGRDTRLSGDLIESALTAGLCSMGADVLRAGVIPTPAVAFLARELGADAGLVISASHNPFGDNGVKVFSGDGFKLPDAEEDALEAMATSPEPPGPRPTGRDVGTVRPIDDALPRYLAFCRGAFPPDRTLHGMKLVLDCAHGATSRAAPPVFADLGAEVTVLNRAPDGININDGCGATHPGPLAEAVRAAGADAGLAFDGDGDRLIVVDEQGGILSGEHVLAVCARHLQGAGRLAKPLVVGTVMSNFAFKQALESLGIDYEEAAVGDRYVLERMRATGATLGGEPSGHLIFLDHHTTGDGIVAALRFLDAVQAAGTAVSEAASFLRLAPQHMVNVPVRRKPPLASCEELAEAVRSAEEELAGRGRVLIRYSGTEPKCRVMVEGPSEEVTLRLTETLAGVVRGCLGDG